MQKGENGVFKGFFVDLPWDMWYAECVGAAEKPPIFLRFSTTHGCRKDSIQLIST